MRGFSPRPNAKDCESIELQLDRLRAHCLAHNWTVIGEPFTDANTSGSEKGTNLRAALTNRPGLEAAIAATVANKATLCVYDLFRLSRSSAQTLLLLHELHQKECTVASLRESLDTTTPMGRCQLTFMAAMGQFQREQTSQRTSDAIRRLDEKHRRFTPGPMRDGLTTKGLPFKGAKPFGMIGPGLSCIPYGWRQSTYGDLLEKVPAEQDVIELVCGLHATGMKPAAIARFLNHKQIQPRVKDSVWQAIQIERIIKRKQRQKAG